jgi:hypothetical protein
MPIGRAIGNHREALAQPQAYQMIQDYQQLSNPFKCQCQQSWLFFQWEECMAQVLDGELASHHFPFQDQ